MEKKAFTQHRRNGHAGKPQKMLEWVPPESRRKGCPERGWKQGVLHEMKECQLLEGLRVDRRLWWLGVAEHNRKKLL